MKKHELADILTRGHAVHGYHLTEAEASDIAAQVLQAQADPLTQLLDAALAFGGGLGLVLWERKHPGAIATLREWIDENAEAIAVADTPHGLYVDMRDGSASIVTLYRDTSATRTAVDSAQMWTPPAQVTP